MSISQQALEAFKETAENPYIVLLPRWDSAAIDELLPLEMVEYNAAGDWYEVTPHGFTVARQLGFDCGWWFGLQSLRIAACLT